MPQDEAVAISDMKPLLQAEATLLDAALSLLTYGVLIYFTFTLIPNVCSKVITVINFEGVKPS